MPTENEQQTIENDNDESSDELLELKKKLAEEIVKKLQEKDSSLLTSMLEWRITDYLVDENTIWDILHDKLLLWGLWKSAWIITPILTKYREMLSKAKTKDDLENLKITIFNEIWEDNKNSSNNQTSTENNQNSSNNQTSSKNNQNTSSNQISNNSKTTSNWSNTSWWTSEKAKVDTSGQKYEIDHFNITASFEAREMWNKLKWKEKPDLEPFSCAMKAYKTEKANWHLKNTKYLTVVDFTKNQQTQNRFFVINLDNNTVEYAEKCWHGEWSGDAQWAKSFSNKSWSHQSSLWASITPDSSKSNTKNTWKWSFVKWQEKSNNASRWIAIHPVKSLTYKSWKPTSEWCFTLPISQNKVDEILNKINWWSLVFAYAKSKDYFAQSNYFQQNADGSVAA